MNGIKTMKHLIRGVLTWGILMVLLVGCERSKLPFIGESDVSVTPTFPVAVNLTQTPEAIGTFVAASADASSTVDGSPTAEATATALPTAIPTATLTPFPLATDTGKPTTVAVPPSATATEVEVRAASEQNTATPEPEATAVAVEPTATTPPTAIKPTVRAPQSGTPLAQQAIALLAQESGLAPGQLTVVKQHGIEWPDSSLGCPQPGMMYLQVLSNGTVIVIQGNGQTYYVHADESGKLFVCNTPDPALKKMTGY